MPQSDIFEAPQGNTFHAEPLLQAITESFVGNGVRSNGDADVTADGATDMGIDVAATSDAIVYGGTKYTPSAASFILSDGPTTTTTVDGTSIDDSRVDIVYLNPGSGYATTEGTAAAYPTPPSVPSGALLLAIVLIPHEATNITDDEIMNWRARPVAGEGVVVSKTSDYTAADNETVLADASSAAITVTLPTPASGAEVTVKKTDATNNVTVSNNGSENIDGSTSQTLSAQYDSIKVVSDGTDWFIVARE